MYDKAETLAGPASGDNALVLGFAALYPPIAGARQVVGLGSL